LDSQACIDDMSYKTKQRQHNGFFLVPYQFGHFQA
jgi:hypothetical protein